MPTDTELVKGTLQGIIASTISGNVNPTAQVINPNAANVNAAAEVQKQRRKIEYIPKATADGAAATATAETSGFCGTSAAQRLYAAYFTPLAGTAADNANFATITVSVKPVAGGASVPIATLSTTITAGGALVADVRKPMVLSTVNNTFVDGQEFTYSITKSGTGAVIAAGYISLFLEDV